MKSRTPPKPDTPQPVGIPAWRLWLLGATIALEAAWVILLVAMTLAR